jgi:hypothetical protein
MMLMYPDDGDDSHDNDDNNDAGGDNDNNDRFLIFKAFINIYDTIHT